MKFGAVFFTVFVSFSVVYAMEENKESDEIVSGEGLPTNELVIMALYHSADIFSQDENSFIELLETYYCFNKDSNLSLIDFHVQNEWTIIRDKYPISREIFCDKMANNSSFALLMKLSLGTELHQSVDYDEYLYYYYSAVLLGNNIFLLPPKHFCGAIIANNYRNYQSYIQEALDKLQVHSESTEEFTYETKPSNRRRV